MWDVEECVRGERGRQCGGGGGGGGGVSVQRRPRRCWGGYHWGGGGGGVGYKEECALTFLACPPHCSRLMRRGRERSGFQRRDKTNGAPAGTERLSSQLRNSKRRT